MQKKEKATYTSFLKSRQGERMKEYMLEFLSEEFERHTQKILEDEKKERAAYEEFHCLDGEGVKPMEFYLCKALKVIVDEIIALQNEVIELQRRE